MCVLFALFYHVNPEYYLLVVPAIVLSPFALPLRATVTLLCGVPWLVNITYAARWRLAKGVDDPVSRLFSEASSAIAMHQFALGLSTICSLLVAAWSLWWLRELRSQSEPRHLADAS